MLHDWEYRYASAGHRYLKRVGVHTVVHVDTEHPKHAQWVTCLVSMQAMEELENVQLPGIVYRSLQHGVVHYVET